LTDIVTGPEGFTADYFTTLLRSRGLIGPGEFVMEVASEPIGNGLTARSLRVSLSYSPPGAGPQTLVAKYASEDEGTFAVAQAARLYESEVAFYREVAPLVTAHVPRCFVAQHDPGSGMFTVVIEDLAQHARPGDALAVLTPADAAMIAEELVGLQVPTWNDPRIHGLSSLADKAPTFAMFDQFAQGTEPFVSRHRRNLAGEHIRFFQSVVPRAGQWIRSWSQPSVFQHGDFRTDNFMFGRTPTDPFVTIIDFQTGRVGPPGVDLAYMIASTLSEQDRRDHGREIVESYHSRLIAGGITDFDFDACWQSYREGALYGIFLWVGMSAGLEATERGDRMIAEQIGRFANMALELDAAGAAGLN
jgi:aminoglycoside/choline kinase family phosphotransferase